MKEVKELIIIARKWLAVFAPAPAFFWLTAFTWKSFDDHIHNIVYSHQNAVVALQYTVNVLFFLAAIASMAAMVLVPMLLYYLLFVKPKKSV